MKKAFSLVELFMMIFVMVAVFFIVVPFSLSNMKQAQFIAEWKEYIEQVNYSYETLQEYKKVNEVDAKAATMTLMSYLDAKKVDSDNEKVKRYSYRFKNDGLFQKNNLKEKDTFYDNKNRLIWVEYGKNCSHSEACLTVYNDMNGARKPNVVGKDIFLYEIYKYKVEPYRKDSDFDTLKIDCDTGGTGMSCSKYFLLGGDIK